MILVIIYNYHSIHGVYEPPNRTRRAHIVGCFLRIELPPSAVTFAAILSALEARLVLVMSATETWHFTRNRRVHQSLDWFVGESLQETMGFLPSNIGLL